MNNYEGLFVVSSNLNKEGLDKTASYLKEQVVKYKGTVEKIEDLGKKRLSYRLNKQREGQYYLLNFKAEPQTIKELEHAYKLNDSILRVLITKKEK